MRAWRYMIWLVHFWQRGERVEIVGKDSFKVRKGDSAVLIHGVLCGDWQDVRHRGQRCGVSLCGLFHSHISPGRAAILRLWSWSWSTAMLCEEDEWWKQRNQNIARWRWVRSRWGEGAGSPRGECLQVTPAAAKQNREEIRDVLSHAPSGFVP